MQRPASDQACVVLKSEGPGLYPGEIADKQRKYDKSRAHLFCLFHAHNCQQEELAGRQTRCNKEFCRTFRTVVSHIAECILGATCSNPFCYGSKKLVNHWQNCQKVDCTLCGPIVQNRKSISRASGWQKTFHQTQRSKAVKAFFVFPDLKDVPVDDQRMSRFTQSVKEIEKDLFIKSSSVEEYINGLVTKCQKIIQDSQFRGSSLNREENNTSISEIKEKFHLDLGINVPKQEEVKLTNGECSKVDEIVIKKEAEEGPEIKTDRPVVEALTNRNSAVAPTTGSNLKTWDQSDLVASFLPLLDKLYEERDAEPFLEPVNWELLRIPNYPEIIKNPMDLSTIRRKLNDYLYNDPWEVVDDFWLMFNNAWLFNKKNSKLSEIFEILVNPVMQSLGFCCGREEIFLPQILNCTTMNLCRINRDAYYYQFSNSNKSDTGLCMDKYPICEKCFNDAHANVGITDDTTLVNIPKSQFEKMKNSKKELEPMIYCRECGRKWHQICASHMDEIWSRGFICPSCTQITNYKRPINPYTAAKLPTTKLSMYIESRVKKFLQRNAADNTGEVFIRVLASSDKVVEVKPGMKARYCETGEMPESFPYRVKAIFAFQFFDGQEVCFFGLHVQEYGSDCPTPNKRRVYIAYLDSVYYFQPKHLRTALYHEILVSYLSYARLMRYTMAHIWACPPSEGDDYIFHMHPPDQKIPKPKRLQEWYQAMLKKAQTENVVVDYKDICKDACTNMTVSPTDLPYFEGDYWPNALEEIFKELDDEENKRKKEQELYDEEEDDEEFCNGSNQSPGSNSGGPNSNQSSQGGVSSNITPSNGNIVSKKHKNKKRKLKKGVSNGLSKKKKSDLGSIVDLNQEVSKRVYDSMEKHKDNFFVIRLYSASQAAILPPIKDPDRLISSELMDCRDSFLNYAREKHLEFSTLRRAKFSTLHMLYDIHNIDKPPLYTCNKCSCTLEYRWHCSQCEEFDLCNSCKENYGHEHPLKRLCPEDGKPGGERQDSLSSQSNNEKVQRFTQAIAHCINCRDSNCRVQYCKEFKKFLAHYNAHGNRTCEICRKILMCSVYHSKNCNVTNCSFPMCQQLKQTLRNSQAQQRAQQSILVRRRMAMMQRSMSNSNTNTQAESNYPPTSSPSPASANTPGMSGTYSSTSQSLQSPHAQNHPLGGKIPHHSPLPASSPYYPQTQQSSPYQQGANMIPMHQSPQTPVYNNGGKPSGPSPGGMYSSQSQNTVMPVSQSMYAMPGSAAQQSTAIGMQRQMPTMPINKSMSVPSGMAFAGQQTPPSGGPSPQMNRYPGNQVIPGGPGFNQGYGQIQDTNFINRMPMNRIPRAQTPNQGSWPQGQPRLPAPPANVNMNDVQNVQKYYSMMQTQGDPSVDDFFKWVSSSASLFKAWQYLQFNNPNMQQYQQQTNLAQQILEQQEMFINAPPNAQMQYTRPQSQPNMVPNIQQQTMIQSQIPSQTAYWQGQQNPMTQSNAPVRYRQTGVQPPLQTMMKPQNALQQNMVPLMQQNGGMIPSQAQQNLMAQQQNNPQMMMQSTMMDNVPQRFTMQAGPPGMVPGAPRPQFTGGHQGQMIVRNQNMSQQNFYAPTQTSNPTLSQLLSPGQQNAPTLSGASQQTPPPYSGYNHPPN